MVEGETDDFRFGKGLDEVDFGGRSGHWHAFEVAAMLSSRSVLEHDALRTTSTKDEAGTRVSGMTQGTLALDQDNIGIFVFEGFDDGGL